MSEAGIIITQPGVDVSTAADYQMLFNSNWPSLQIAFEKVITVTAGNVSPPIPHGLTFTPLTMTWFLVNGISVGRFYGVTTFDSTNVYIDNSLNTSDVVASIKCYNLDITVNADYTNPLPPTFKLPYDPDYGIKIAKNGKNITSTDLRDFILHSRAQSPAVLHVGTVNQVYATDPNFTGTNIQYTNPAGYVPWVLGFASLTSNTSIYQAYPPGNNQSFPAFVQIGATSYILPSSLGSGTFTNGSLVVLRDPLLIPNTLRIQY